MRAAHPSRIPFPNTSRCRTHPDTPASPNAVAARPGANRVLSALVLSLACAACAPRPVVAPSAARTNATPSDSADGRSAAERSRVVRRIDAYLDSLTRTGQFAGTVLVAERGRTLLERSYGEASVELHVPMTNGLRSRLHSITKRFTATAVLVLAARGRVDLDAPVRRYLPELPAAWDGATVAQVLTHTSGIPNVEEEVWAKNFMEHDVHTQLENLALVAPRLAAMPLVEPPGTKHRYNNFGYDLLACLVERLAGQPFEAFVRAAVFEPAEMANAGFDRRRQAEHGYGYVGSAVVDRLAPGYNGDAGHLIGAAPASYAQAGAGGMYATAEDLLRYDAALTAGTILPPAVARKAVDRAYVLGPRGAYGYGWVITRTADGGYFLHHSGGNNGYVSEYARFPREGAAIIVLSNHSGTDPEAVRRVITHLLFGSRYP